MWGVLVMDHPTYLSARALARRLGINRQTLYRDRQREARYPEPTATLDGAPIYDERVVEAWEADWEREQAG